MPKLSPLDPNRPGFYLNGQPVRTRRYKQKIDLERMFKMTMTVMVRDIEKLMDKSHKAKLTRDESTSLVAYLKLLNEMKALKELEEIEAKKKEQE